MSSHAITSAYEQVSNAIDGVRLLVECEVGGKSKYVDWKPQISRSSPMQGLEVQITMPIDATLTISADDTDKHLRVLGTRWSEGNHTNRVVQMETLSVTVTMRDLAKYGSRIELDLVFDTILPCTQPDPIKLAVPLQFKVGEFGVVVTKEDRLTPQSERPAEDSSEKSPFEGVSSKRARGAP